MISAAKFDTLFEALFDRTGYLVAKGTGRRTLYSQAGSFTHTFATGGTSASPSTPVAVEVIAIGGGGGGGGLPAATSGSRYFGAGGGSSGSWTHARFAGTPPATANVVVGSGGADGLNATGGGGPGANGNPSSVTWLGFAAYAPGGVGGGTGGLSGPGPGGAVSGRYLSWTAAGGVGGATGGFAGSAGEYGFSAPGGASAATAGGVNQSGVNGAGYGHGNGGQTVSAGLHGSGGGGGGGVAVDGFGSHDGAVLIIEYFAFDNVAGATS